MQTVSIELLVTSARLESVSWRQGTIGSLPIVSEPFHTAYIDLIGEVNLQVLEEVL